MIAHVLSAMFQKLGEGVTIRSCFQESRNTAHFFSDTLSPLSVTNPQTILTANVKGTDHRNQFKLSFYSVLELLFWLLVSEPHTADFQLKGAQDVKAGRQSLESWKH